MLTKARSAETHLHSLLCVDDDVLTSPSSYLETIHSALILTEYGMTEFPPAIRTPALEVPEVWHFRHYLMLATQILH